MDSQPSSSAKAMVNFFMGDSLLYAFTFVATIVRLRLYKVSDYGTFQLALSLIPVVSTAVCLGFPLLLLTSIPKLEKENRRTQIRLMVRAGIYFVLFLDAAVLFLSLITLRFDLSREYTISVRILPLLIFNSAISRIFNNALLALNKSKIIVSFNFLNLIIGAFVTICIYVIVHDIFLVLICYAVAGVIVSLYQIGFLFRSLGISSGDGANRETRYAHIFREAFLYGKWDVPTSLMWNGYSSVSLMVISSLAGLEAVAFLAFALSVTTVVFVPFTKISDVVLQKLCLEQTGQASKTAITGKENQDILLPLLVVLVSLSILAITVLIRTVLGSKYGPSLPYILILSCSTPIQFLIYLMKNVPLSHGQIKLANKPELYAFALFAVIVYPSAIVGGGIGVAVSLLLSRFVIAVLMISLYGEYRSFSFRWMPFLILIPASWLITINYLWLVPYLVLLALLVRREKVIFAKCLRAVKPYFGTLKPYVLGTHT